MCFVGSIDCINLLAAAAGDPTDSENNEASDYGEDEEEEEQQEDLEEEEDFGEEEIDNHRGSNKRPPLPPRKSHSNRSGPHKRPTVSNRPPTRKQGTKKSIPRKARKTDPGTPTLEEEDQDPPSESQAPTLHKHKEQRRLNQQFGTPTNHFHENATFNRPPPNQNSTMVTGTRGSKGDDVKALKAELAALKRDKAALEKKVTKLTREKDTLQAENHAIIDENNNLRDQNAKLTKTLEAKLTASAGEVNAVNKEMAAMISRITKRETWRLVKFIGVIDGCLSVIVISCSVITHLSIPFLLFRIQNRNVSSA